MIKRPVLPGILPGNAGRAFSGIVQNCRNVRTLRSKYWFRLCPVLVSEKNFSLKCEKNDLTHALSKPLPFREWIPWSCNFSSWAWYNLLVYWNHWSEWIAAPGIVESLSMVASTRARAFLGERAWATTSFFLNSLALLSHTRILILQMRILFWVSLDVPNGWFYHAHSPTIPWVGLGDPLTKTLFILDS